MASDLDFTVLDLRCMMSPKYEKCLWSWIVACCCSSDLEWKRKKLSSM